MMMLVIQMQSFLISQDRTIVSVKPVSPETTTQKAAFDVAVQLVMKVTAFLAKIPTSARKTTCALKTRNA